MLIEQFLPAAHQRMCCIHLTPRLNARDVLQNLWEEVQYEEDLLFNYVMNVGYR